MKRLIYFQILFASVLLLTTSWSADAKCQHPNDDLVLWYKSPAMIWEESLPLGNGHLGAMPYGGIAQERIVLNEETLWSGSVQQTLNDQAAGWLPQIRDLLLQGRNLEAQRMMYEHFTCAGGGSSSPQYGSYQTLGAMLLEHDIDESKVTDYRRELNLRDGVATTSFRSGATHYEQKVFVSLASPDVVVVHLRAKGDDKLNFDLSLWREERATFAIEDNSVITMQGEMDSGSDTIPGMRYLAVAQLISNGRQSSEGESLRCEGATEATIYLSACTDYRSSLLEQRPSNNIHDAIDLGYRSLLKEHIASHRALMDRVVIDLGEQQLDIPTDRRIQLFAEEDDWSLAALYAQYGRYLLIGSTARAVLPPNLQGIWAEKCINPWNGDYHLNINLQMNHWPLEVGNLSELIYPLTDYVEGMVPSGERSARCFYDAEGWCAHVLANAWQFTAPSEDPSWGATNTGGAWIALHLWEHYLFTLDKEYLLRVYPTLRGAAQFLQSNLMTLSNGWMVTAPSSSPENGFYIDGSDEVIYVCQGPAMDSQIARELFGAVVTASEILECDEELREELQRISQHLPPTQIDAEGRVMEWLEPYREQDPQHRHISHLFALYPGSQISKDDAALSEACRQTLDRRGDEGTGWSRAWKICFRARLGDGDRALKLLRSLLQDAIVEWGHRGGTFPNLFCSHPPFQIDGNFGGSAGIMEMLLQSHDGAIELLPALPAAWSEGEYRGLKARGNVEVDCRWAEGRVIEATLRSATSQRVTLRLADGTVREVECRAGKPSKVKF